MNYKVLYRKYRPDNFDNLVGQNHVVEILKNSIKDQKIAHAYMFSGPRGTGKTSTARILAKAINCLNNEDGLACGKCANCLSFNNSPDIIEIDAASNTGVNDIRELLNNIKIMPTSLKYKVYIIDEVHMLSDSAFNALLLTLEEPPEHVIFILATTNLESVPITILSRCQRFDFKRITNKEIINRLKFVADNEKINYTEEALKEIAILADGGLRDALSILDQLSKNNAEINLDLVIKEIGTISNQKIFDLIDAVDDKNINKIEEIINDFRNINLNYKVAIKKIIDVLMEKAIKYLKGDNIKNLTYDDYQKLVFDLNEIINKINISIDPYILIEITLLKYTRSTWKIPQVSLENKVEEKLKENLDSSQEQIKSKEPIKNNAKKSLKIDVRINNCFVKASKEYLKIAKDEWTTFQENCDDYIKRLIVDTTVVTASNDYIILETTVKHKDDELNEKVELIEEKFKDVIKNEKKLVFIDSTRWLKEKNDYINNLKKGYKYSIKEETKENDENNLNEIATNIFNASKIEYQ